MIDLFKLINKKTTFMTIFLKSCIYLCWYFFAIVFSIFIYDYLTDTKIFLVLLFIGIIYIFRNMLKYLHNKDANQAHYNVKHEIEMYYFKKIQSSKAYYSDSILKKLDKEILDFSYLFTKIIFDLGEVIIPFILGMIILYAKLFEVNFIMSLISLIYISLLLVLKYKKTDLKNGVNYNDLLNDFIFKFDTIRKLKVFDYCVNKLDENEENDIVILKKEAEDNDIKFSNGIIIYFLFMLLVIFFSIKNNVTKVGLLIFVIVIMIKLQNVLYDLPNTIKRIISLKSRKKNLDNMYGEKVSLKSVKNFKTVTLNEVKVNYKDTNTCISIPSFELIKGDTIGILGKSGQGKSTVLNILSGLSNINEGKILIDGEEKKYPIDVVYLSTSVKMFSLSLRDNLTLGKKIDDKKVIELINEIGLEEWFNSLDNGLETIVNDVSDAVLRRLNIIRAIIMDKEVYLFDEITSGLNLDSEKKVVSMIKKYFKDKTFIIISDRPILNNICSKHYFIKNHTLLEKESLL